MWKDLVIKDFRDKIDWASDDVAVAQDLGLFLAGSKGGWMIDDVPDSKRIVLRHGLRAVQNGAVKAAENVRIGIEAMVVDS